VNPTAPVANSGMEWNDRRTSLTGWGKPPTSIEPVTGELVLKHLRRARSVSVQPLDGAGRPRWAGRFRRGSPAKAGRSAWVNRRRLGSS